MDINMYAFFINTCRCVSIMHSHHISRIHKHRGNHLINYLMKYRIKKPHDKQNPTFVKIKIFKEQFMPWVTIKRN